MSQDIKEIRLFLDIIFYNCNGFPNLHQGNIEFIYSLTYLEKLYVSGNPIDVQRLYSLKFLKTLTIVDLAVYELPANIDTLSTLQELTISNVRLQSLPDSVTNLRNLTYLNIRNNGLQQLPQSICNLENLETLDAGCNKIVSLPESITNLRKLTALLIDLNKLTYIPERICSMPSLRTLKLHENPIGELPESIAYNKKLRYNNIHPWILEDFEEYSKQKRRIIEESYNLYKTAKMRIFLRTYFALSLKCGLLVIQAILLTTRPITFKKN